MALIQKNHAIPTDAQNEFQPESQLEVLDFGISQLEQEVRDHPMVFSYLNLGQLYHFKARGLEDGAAKQTLFAEAAGAYDKALQLAPNRLEVYYSYLQWSFDTKNYDKGVALMKKAAEINPTYPQNFWYLGFAYINAGNDSEAVNAINQALVLWYQRWGVILENGRLKYNVDDFLKVAYGFAPEQEILGVVNPYIKLKMWPELLIFYLSIEKQDPNNVQIHQSLALVYQNLGLQEKALEELKIIDSLNK